MELCRQSSDRPKAPLFYSIAQNYFFVILPKYDFQFFIQFRQIFFKKRVFFEQIKKSALHLSKTVSQKKPGAHTITMNYRRFMAEKKEDFYDEWKGYIISGSRNSAKRPALWFRLYSDKPDLWFLQRIRLCKIDIKSIQTARYPPSFPAVCMLPFVYFPNTPALSIIT